MADDSVSTRTILDGAVTEPKLADNSVSTRTIIDRAVTEPKLANNAVSTRTIQDKAVTPAKLSDEVHRVLYDLQNQINGFYEHGVAVSSVFGENTNIGISQKTLTDAINNIYTILEDNLDITIKGFTWTVTPTYIYGQGETEITVTAQPVEEDGILEKVELLVDGVKVDDAEALMVTEYTYTFTTDRPVEVRMNAWVRGMEYNRTVNITDSFWMGAGSTYNNVFLNGAPTNLVNVGKGMRVAKNVSFGDNTYLFIIMGNYLTDSFVRADINGVELELLPADTTTLEGFTIYKSANAFNSGIYNIDING